MLRTYTPTGLLTIMSLIVIFGCVDINAQNTSDRAAVKKWLIANKDNITLVTSEEYQSMSPSIKAMVSSDSKTIIYNKEVKVSDVLAFENQNTPTSYVPFIDEKQLKKNMNPEESAISQEERISVKNWLENEGQGVKVISNTEFMSLPEEHRIAVGTSNVLIYKGKELTMNEIKMYKEGSSDN